MKHVFRNYSKTIMGAFVTNFTIAYIVLWLIAQENKMIEIIELSLLISIITTTITVSYSMYNPRYKTMLKLRFT